MFKSDHFLVFEENHYSCAKLVTVQRNEREYFASLCMCIRDATLSTTEGFPSGTFFLTPMAHSLLGNQWFSITRREMESLTELNVFLRIILKIYQRTT